MVFMLLMALNTAVAQNTHYVSLAGTNNYPYTNWADSATNIQWAMDASAAGDTVLVSNGTYNLTNMVTINPSVILQSVNGKDLTFINGNYPNVTNRCIFINDGGVLDGFTLTNGYAKNDDILGRAGGVYCTANTYVKNCMIEHNYATSRGGGVYMDGGMVSNCVLSHNSSLQEGGGEYGGGNLWNCMIVSNSSVSSSSGGIQGATLRNCTIIGNSAAVNAGGVGWSDAYNCMIVGNTAASLGGGARQGNLYNCTIVGNNANQFQGGTSEGILFNCIVYFNTSPNNDTRNYGGSSFTNSCTIPAQAGWSTSNTTNDPMFIANGSDYGTNHIAGNYRLKANSPCINAGTNYSWMTDSGVRNRDMDGRQRIRYGTVDMGAYEAIYNGTIYRLGF